MRTQILLILLGITSHFSACKDSDLAGGRCTYTEMKGQGSQEIYYGKT